MCNAIVEKSKLQKLSGFSKRITNKVYRNDIKIVGVICSSNSKKRNKDLGLEMGYEELGIKIEGIDNLEEVLLKCKPDVVVDFSTAESTMKTSEIILKLKINMVIGTTGFTDDYIENLRCLADYDFQITEIHHKNKKDIPSGTAERIKSEI